MTIFKRIILITRDSGTDLMYELTRRRLNDEEARIADKMIGDCGITPETPRSIQPADLQKQDVISTLFVNFDDYRTCRIDFSQSAPSAPLKPIIDYVKGHVKPMGAFGVNLHSITFSDQTPVELQSDEILVITGPNNSGKSQTLRDISSGLIGEKRRYYVVTALTAGHFNETKMHWYLSDFAVEGTKEFIAFIDETKTVQGTH